MSDPNDDDVELVLEGKPRDLGDGFQVARVLPAVARRMVGPFVFFDHFGPVTMPPGQGLDVRPHPHIGLATVTYLFEGAIVHKDSLGSDLTIRPGAVNWMNAGRGIVHSERTAAEERAKGPRMHGLQLWVALPMTHEDSEPTFSHFDAPTFPEVERDGVRVRVLVGRAFGVTSPVPTAWPTLYVELMLPGGASIEISPDADERAAYVVSGTARAGAHVLGPRAMAVFRANRTVTLTADDGGAHVMLIGGAKMDGPRHVFWNFVSSSKERIERAKDDWRAGRFPKVPGDEVDFIPLPE